MPDKMTLQQAFDQAVALHRLGQLENAQKLYRQIAELQPFHFPTTFMLGMLLLQQGRNEDAYAAFDRAVKLDPSRADAWNNHAIALCNLGRFAEAVPSYDKAIKLDQNHVESWNNRGAALQELERFDEALASFDGALSRKRDYAEALNNRAGTLQKLRRPQEALIDCRKALALKPDYPKALNNLGMILCDLTSYEEALAAFDLVLARHPDYAQAWNNRGNVLWEMERHDEALSSYNRALSLNPDYAEALFNRGNTLWSEYKEFAPAVADLEKVLRLDPDYDYARGGLLHLRMHGGDWQDFAPQLQQIDIAVRAGKRVIEPFAYMALSQSAADLHTCAVIQCEDGYPAKPPLKTKAHPAGGKIRLGYVSGEFREQATAYLMAGLYEAHDKSRFELIAFDNGSSDAGPTRQRLEAAFAKFIDISQMDDRTAAACVAGEDIDILINLNGYFGEHRMGLFAHRPAPLQVNYLGFPGTLGAEYIDYIIADRTVIPQADFAHYSEKIVWLPDSYQVNDSRRAVPVLSTRAEHGLPDKAFVFCSFNQSYKLTPQTFAAWMRILRQVEGSVLWLLESNPVFAAHLRREAVRQGVSADRLIFAPVIPAAQHMARLGLADLFLDTMPCNAHTTASDALWAGLPLITCLGTAFAGRVAASLLQACGLSALVAETPQAYESLAVRLACSPELLQDFRQRLVQGRAAHALFNTHGYCRHIESAFAHMLQLHSAGESPCNFAIDA